MSGHNKWSQIKTKKAAVDQKRAKVFSKILLAISVAAREEPNPEFNPRLRSIVEKAREHNIPNENIARAIHRASNDTALEELRIEAYGPGGVAIIIEAITDNRNRTIAEIRHILEEHGGKLAEQGSVLWAFEYSKESRVWRPKFPQLLDQNTKTSIDAVVNALEEHTDVESVIINT